MPRIHTTDRYLSSSLLFLIAWAWLASSVSAATYYVSSSTGDDTHAGTSPASAFRTLARVNMVNLQPGDEIRLFCGDTWRADPLQITDSGTASEPILVTSHPTGCADRPVLSGSRQVSGWTVAGVNLFRAELDAGANAGDFPLGINQLFRNGGRLPLGRWPNVQGHPDGGYTKVDSSPSSTRITDAELPAGDWTGAVVRLKGIRWYLLNRTVTTQVGTTLTVNDPLICYQDDGQNVLGPGGDCSGWGYYLTDHLATLDQEGEWYYDPVAQDLYLHSTGPLPADGEIEASVILPAEGIFHGGITLGARTFGVSSHISWVTIENLRVERWFDNGMTFPENLLNDENSNLTLRNTQVLDVNGVGIRLTTWVPQPSPGVGPVGWRGGRDLLIEDNLVAGANQQGIFAYSVSTQFLDNEIRDIALIEELGRDGMGCGFTGNNCTENGDGLFVFFAPEVPDHTGRDNIIRGNLLHNIGMNGIDVYGRHHLIENNVVDGACQSKGDCGGIRIYGRNNLATTPTHDVTIRANIVRDTYGNVDGVRPFFDYLFGFGIYVDNWVRDIVTEDNTVTGGSWVGIIYQLATGIARNNLLYDNVASDYGSEMSLIGSVSSVEVTGNTFFPIGFLRESFRVSELSTLATGNGNRFFSPYDTTSIWDETLAGDPNFDDRLTLAEWQAHSSQDGTSTTHWYTQAAGETPHSQIFINDSAATIQVPLVGTYLDLDQNPAGNSLTLGPFSGRVLVRQAVAIFDDNFESGDTTAWSVSSP